MSPGYADVSLVREKLAADIFRSAGIPAARTSFYRVSIDFGAGLKYCGVYTMVEVIDDTMVRDQFGDREGNIYKPQSRLLSFVEREFEKKNNELAADYSDVRAFIAALNNPVRTTDAAQWRAGLEATFDVDHFLKRLAVNNAIVNWDTYGAIAHNYYLYNHPARKLVWIPWDHNMSMTGNPPITAPAPMPGMPGPGIGQGVSLAMNELGTNWPLLRFIASDSTYFPRYKAYMKTFNGTVLAPGSLESTIDRYAALISPYVMGPSGEQTGYSHLPTQAAFPTGVASLKTHLQTRRALVATFTQ